MMIAARIVGDDAVLGSKSRRVQHSLFAESRVRMD
jgi:hypothetical protein